MKDFYHTCKLVLLRPVLWDNIYPFPYCICSLWAPKNVGDFGQKLERSSPENCTLTLMKNLLFDVLWLTKVSSMILNYRFKIKILEMPVTVINWVTKKKKRKKSRQLPSDIMKCLDLNLKRTPTLWKSPRRKEKLLIISKTFKKITVFRA